MKNIFKISLIAFLFLFAPKAEANTCVAAAGAAGNWTSAAAWTACGGVAPTAADDTTITAITTSITINSGAVARSVNFTGFTGTATHTSGVTLTIGDGTAGLGNVALTMVSGMTYSLGSNTTSAISFVSTSGTVQTIDFGALRMGNQTFNGAGGSWQITGADANTTTGVLTLTNGTLNTNNINNFFGSFSSDNGNTRTLTIGSSNNTMTSACWSTTNVTGLTMTANTGTTTCAAQLSPIFTSGTKDYNGMSLVMTSSGATGSINSAGSTFKNLTYTGSANKTDILQFNAGFTVTGTLTFTGNSVTNRLLVQSNTLGTARTITNTGATMTWSNVDLKDITLGTSFNASAIIGLSGDCGGNSNITFTTAATQTSTGTASFSWSTHGWTSRVPLPQDDVVISNVFVSARTVTTDMPRLGKNIDMSGATWAGTAPVWSTGGNIPTIFGSLSFPNQAGTGITITTGGNIETFEGRGSFTLNQNGATITTSMNTIIAAIGGTYTLTSAYNAGNGGTGITLNNGTFNDGGFSFTSNVFISTSNLTRAIVRSGTWTLAGTGAVYNVTATNLTQTDSGTVIIPDITTTSKTFTGGSLSGANSYNNLTITGQNVIVAGSNTFGGTTALSTAGKQYGIGTHFTQSTTQTVANFTVNSTSTVDRVLASSTTATNATLTKSGGGTVCLDFISIQDLTGTPVSTWYAGANSVDGGDNTNWTFTACPVVGGGEEYFQIIN